MSVCFLLVLDDKIVGYSVVKVLYLADRGFFLPVSTDLLVF